ncbi:MAG: hypothetical protein AAF367_06585 [Pseudomonadota bacterium]
MTDAPLIGIVTPPGWYDPTAAEFERLCVAPVRTQQCIVAVPDLDYDDLNAIAAALPEVERAAQMMGLTGAAAVAMTGTPFVWAGLAAEPDIRLRLAGVTAAAACPTVMAGTAIMDALRALGAERIAVATPYYTKSWRNQTEVALRAAGFDVLAVQSADDLELIEAIASIDDHARLSSADQLREIMRRLIGANPGADALVVAGAGARLLEMTPAMEAELGLPVVASDTALYWALAGALGLELRPGALGKMGALL